MATGFFHEQAVPAVGDLPSASIHSADWKVREAHLKQFVQHKFPLILGWDLSGGICHGVRPPLTATMKRPRTATDARASAAINFAAAWATESAFVRT